MLEISGPDLEQAQKYDGVKPVKSILIADSYTTI